MDPSALTSGFDLEAAVRVVVEGTAAALGLPWYWAPALLVAAALVMKGVRAARTKRTALRVVPDPSPLEVSPSSSFPRGPTDSDESLG